MTTKNIDIGLPANWIGTKPEYAVYLALIKIGVAFDYQSSKMGGRLARGGSVIDFWIPSLNLAINVMGEYWHYERGTLGHDQLQRAALESQGIRVIYIDEKDALTNALYFVQEAIKGIDHSRMTR